MSNTSSNANASGSSSSCGCANDRALVTFRMVLPTTASPQTVHLIGSWDDFLTALPMEQDVRVGRGVWKGMITEKGGLVMGCDYTYYFLLDSKIFIPDPSSTPELTAVDSKTGRLVSTIYVPLELPPSPEKPPAPSCLFLPTQSPTTPTTEKEKIISPVSVIGSSVFSGIGGVGKTFEEPRKVPEHPSIPSPISAESPSKEPGSLRGILRGRSGRRASIFPFSADKGTPVSAEEVVVKRKWTLAKRASQIFRARSKVRTGEGDKALRVDLSDKSKVVVGIGREVLPNKQVPPPVSMNSDKISDIVGYLRDTSGLATNQSRVSQPQQPAHAQAYYHSPVTSDHSYTGLSQRKPQRSRPPLPSSSRRTASDASKMSSDTAETSPSLYHSVVSACSCRVPSTCSCSPDLPSIFPLEESCVSDGGGDSGEDFYEVETPSEGLGIAASIYSQHRPRPTQQEKDQKKRVYPKYYNFDELSAGGPGGNRDIGRYAGDVILGEVNGGGYGFPAGGMKSLECLREEVAGELAWRSELIDELGYLGGIVV